MDNKEAAKIILAASYFDESATYRAVPEPVEGRFLLPAGKNILCINVGFVFAV